MIVLSDADLERAANFATYYSMQNAGQTCISIERGVRRGARVRRVRGESVRESARPALGPAQGPGSVEVGAITFPPQLEKIEDHVADAIDKGARVLAGGHSSSAGGGRFFEPTVLVDVDHTMKIMNDETFGPTLPIMKVTDAEEALKLANDSPYGLGASVFTRDIPRGEAHRPPAGGGHGERERHDHQLHRAGVPDGRRQGLGSRLAAWRGRDPQVLLPAGDRGDAASSPSSARCTCSRTRPAPRRCSRACSS